MSTRKRNIAQEVEFYTKKDKVLKKRKDGLSEAFLRPAYQYTTLENDTVARLHEDDWRF